MSSSDRGRGDTPGTRHEPVTPGATPPDPAADGADPYASWLDRDNWEDDDPDAKGLVPAAPKIPAPRK
jgi:hypothetical protein